MTVQCKPMDLRCEFLVNPLGIDETLPRLSWKLDDPRDGAKQTAYQVQAASTPEKLAARAVLWDSGMVKSDQSLDVVYQGRKLKSRDRVYWRVRVWDLDGTPSGWSETAVFELGLLKKTDWKAQWIGSGAIHDSEKPCPYLRRTFTAERRPARARLYIAAQGLFEAWINGQRVSSDYFTPGWTDYAKRIHYLTYDVTAMLRQGPNAVGAILGDGWFAGSLGWGKNRNVYGKVPGLLAQLEILYDDGSDETVCTGPQWKTVTGPILSSDIYNGENYDARLDLGDWSSAAYDDFTWQPVTVAEPPKARLAAKPDLPVRKQEELHAEILSQPKPGVWVFDLGQNMVGWARIRIRQEHDRTVTVRFAEMLNDDGTLYLANLRRARATDTYVCAGGGEQTWEPRFTFHGFRYVELTGLDSQPDIKDVTGVVLHSDIERTGTFECSDPKVNRLQKNIEWGQKGNFLEVPTDCPQRDERLGWTGDAQVFVRTACFNRDVAAFFEKWCNDIADDQLADGRVPHVIPNVLGKDGGCAAWADAVVICPWTIYQCFGDRRILERQFDAMRKWVDWRVKNSRNFVNNSACFGDWLAIDIAEGNPGRSPTPRDLISTAYFAYTAGIVARSAAIIGKKADAKKYTAVHRKAAAAFNREFVSPSGRLAGDTQTAYLLALGFNLLPAGKREYAAKRLVDDIEGRGWHLSTGFVGTPLLTPVLSAIGRTDAAYKLLLQTTYPGWLYTVEQGATTMWERWNSYTKDRGFGDAGMNSFNHYAYGAIGEWLYATVAGIDIDPRQPGYKHVIFRPQPGEGLTWAKASLETRYGRAACGWKIDGKKLVVDVTVPPNTTGTVVLKGQRPRNVAAGSFTFSVPYRK